VTAAAGQLAASPRSLDEVVSCLATEPGATLLAGGTDLMVEVNAGRCRLGPVISLRRVPELRGWRREGDAVVLGACLTFAAAERADLAEVVPALSQAARTVGSPQIRNAATLGGNLCTASPAGDSLPVLAALDATVWLLGPSGPRVMPLTGFVAGVKRTALAGAEFVTAIEVPVVPGRQEFLKVGPRSTMVISVASVAVVLDLARHRVRIGLGAVAPVPVRPAAAERLIESEVDWERGRLRPGADRAGLAGQVALAAAPIDDHRSSAAYRRHAVAVCVRRALDRAL
jgi:CO/xanthine dehydrogenase FAD-binding subunit